jgi:hypothetical protein
MKHSFAFVLLFFAVCYLSANSSKLTKSDLSPLNIKADSLVQAVYFTENKGQIHDGYYNRRSDVLFMGNTPQEQLIISGKGVSHQIKRVLNSGKNKLSKLERLLDTSLKISVDYYRVDMQWLGSNQNPQAEKYKASKDYINYYNVKYAENGILGVRNYESVRLKNVYDGIDVYYYANGSQIEYDYEVSVGADYKQIKIQISGADAFVNANGNLEMKTPLGVVSESAPRVFQNGKELKSSWIQIDAQTWGFEIEQYNPNVAMVIDPLTRVWGTYYGGSASDQFYSGDIDDNGNVYAGGYTKSSNNIATNGSHQSTRSGNYEDGILLKLNTNGSKLWCTYYGGTDEDFIHSLKFSKNYLFIGGETRSTSNMSTIGSFKSALGGNSYFKEGFIAKFDTTGSRIWGTYYGVDGFSDGIVEVDANATGDIFVVGFTESQSGLGTNGAYQVTSTTNGSSFIAKFSSSGSRIWGTYFSAGSIGCIVVDKNSNIICGGTTISNSGISTINAHQPAFIGGGNDAFLVKFNSSGVRLWGTYYGGNGTDYCHSLCVDSLKSVIAVGYTTSSNYIATSGAHRNIVNTASYDAFIVKFDSLGNRNWGTYYGGTNINLFEGVCSDKDGNLFAIGRTQSNSDVATNDAYKIYLTGSNTDGMIVKFSSNGTRLLGSYYGGTDADVFASVKISKLGNLFCFGASASDTGVASYGAAQTVYGGNNLSSPFDGMIVKFGLCKTSSKSFTVSACKSYTWKGNTYTQSGDYTYTAANYLGCDSIVTLKLSILKSVSTLVKLSACDSFVWKGKTYKTSTSFYDTLKSYQACDSIVELQFTVKNSSTRTLSVAVCNQYIWHNDTLKNTGTYYDTAVNAVGCDSITRLDLIIYPSLSTNIQASACKSYTWYGNSYTSNGKYTKKLQSIHGCDSIVYLTLSINRFVRDTVQINTCSKQFNWRGKLLLQTGNYFDTTKVTGNCDSIHMLVLDVTPIGFLVQAVDQYKTVGKTAKYFVQSALPGVSFQWQSNVGFGWINLNNAGQYLGVNTDTLYVKNVILSNDNHKFRCIVKIGNCTDTSNVASLYVCPLITEQPVKKYTGAGGSTFFTVSCDISNASFQWQADNGSGFQNLSNAGLYKGVNTNTLLVNNVALTDNNTLYRCIVTYMNCQDTTDTAALLVLEKFNINLCNNNSFVNVYPNPTHNYVNVLLPSDKVGSPYKITNDLGQVVKTGHIESETSKVDFKEFPSGVYILTIGDELLDCFKIVKIWDR